jgi:heme oxygenase
MIAVCIAVCSQHLGSLSGGQIIKRMTKKQMKLPEGQGTACFDFQVSEVLVDETYLNTCTARTFECWKWAARWEC